MKWNLLSLSQLVAVAGCAATVDQARIAASIQEPPQVPLILPVESIAKNAVPDEPNVVKASHTESAGLSTVSVALHTVESTKDPATTPFESDETLSLERVVSSVYASYPSLTAAISQRDIAAGNRTAAVGAFDLKLKAASESGPVGFYRTYRHNVGLEQPLYGGADVFAGYRVGRGFFQPWYLERQTNDGGEFKAGVLIPLLRNRGIDERRSLLWQSELEQQLAEPEIQAQLIGFVQAASIAYWEWVAAGEMLAISQRVLELADSRTDRIKRQVELGLIDPPELTDNQRLVAQRRAKLADSQRKLQQKASKLSLYLRDSRGEPVLPAANKLPSFPTPEPFDPANFPADAERALQQRPELALLDLVNRQLEVQLNQARNEARPEVNAVLASSQDVGKPTSSKRDKSRFEVEASLLFNMPLQRRKAFGKMQAIQGKQAQVAAKRRLAEDQIKVDVQTVYAALTAALEQIKQTTEAVKLAEDLAQRERRNLEAGASDLLKVTLREQYAAESAVKRVDAYLEYYLAKAAYRAALAVDALP